MADTPAALEVIQGLGAAKGSLGKGVLADAALERLAAARAANLTSRARSIRAVALYVGALGVLGAQVLLIAIVHLLGI
ncbi:MAG TPA: hypothetical protein VEF89_30790 [Solirubrobacteraceae bacterium]|nr:hypothetical protein [Solirubrobacteraceae bacterium]